MKSGSTFILQVNIDVDMDFVDNIIFTIKSGQNTLTKTQYDYDVENNHIEIPFTQEETVQLEGMCLVEAQINFTDKSVAKSKIKDFYIDKTLATKIIYGNKATKYGREIDLDIDGMVVYQVQPYELPIANEDTLGGVMPVNKTEEMTQSVGVDEDGRLFALPNKEFEMPVASEKVLGGVKPFDRTAYMTTPVGVDAYGRLYAEYQDNPFFETVKISTLLAMGMIPSSIPGQYSVILGTNNKVYVTGVGRVCLIGYNNTVEGTGNSTMFGHDNVITFIPNKSTNTGSTVFMAGHHNIASGVGQSVIGKYNLHDENNDYSFIIGGGENDSKRKNILTVDWKGNVHSMEDIYAETVSLKGTAEKVEKIEKTLAGLEDLLATI